MINLKVIYKIIGSLLFIEAALMSVCLIMAMAYGEDDMYAFLFQNIGVPYRPVAEAE